MLLVRRVNCSKYRVYRPKKVVLTLKKLCLIDSQILVFRLIKGIYFSCVYKISYYDIAVEAIKQLFYILIALRSCLHSPGITVNRFYKNFFHNSGYCFVCLL